MNRASALFLAALALLIAPVPVGANVAFLRGDGNGDGAVNTTDAIFGLDHIFLGGPGPCEDAIDANDDGALTISDAVFTLFYLFLSGPPPYAPFPACGLDPTTDGLGCLTPSAGCPGPFSTPVFPGLAYGMRSVAVKAADLNGDAILDIVTAGAGLNAGGLYARYGHGDGSFGPLEILVEPLTARRDIAIGDFDNDLDNDVLFTQLNSGDIWIFANDGTGTMTAQPAINLPQATDLEVGHFDGGSNLDMAVVDAGQLRIYLGQGDLTFVHSSGFPGAALRDIILTDLDNDTDLDVVGVRDGSLVVFVGSGTGTFTHDPADEYTTLNDATEIDAGDINGDGFVDIAIVTNVALNVAFGTGATTPGFALGPVVSYDLNRPSALTDPGGVDVKIVDVDGDLDLDIVSANETLNSLSLFLNDGAGYLTLQDNHPTGSVPVTESCLYMDVADLDGDLDPDLLVATSNDEVEVFLNRGDATFARPGVHEVPGNPIGVHVVDVNGDGDLDVIAKNSLEAVTVSLGNGDGTLQEAQLYPLGPGLAGFHVGDLNLDGPPDLIFNRVSDFQISYGTLAAGYGPPVTVPHPPNGVSSQVGDLNGDGHADIILGTTTALELYLSDGTGVLPTPTQFSLSGASAGRIEVADLDNDGDQDVFVDISGNNYRILLNDGAGNLSSAGDFSQAFNQFNSTSGMGPVIFVDFTGDGTKDLIWSVPGQTRIVLHRGLGGGGFTFDSVLVDGLDGILLPADYDADCHADFMVHKQSRVTLFRGNSDGSATETDAFVGGVDVSGEDASVNVGGLTIADLNADGRPDLIVSNLAGASTDPANSTSTINIFLNQGP